MRLERTWLAPSPDRAGAARLSGIARGRGGVREIWFELDERRAGALSRGGNPWAVALLPFAMETGEAVKLDLPVDALLLENLAGLQAIWTMWHPRLRTVPVLAPAAPPGTRSAGGRTATLFSGGVDSWFTLLRHVPDALPGTPQVGRVEDLLTIWGFDIPWHAAGAFAPVRAESERIAAALGVGATILRTNLRACLTPTLGLANFGLFAHGPMLAAAAFAAEGALGQLLVPSSQSLPQLHAWGTHVLTDGLLSASGLRFAHDAPGFTRAQKVAAIARSPLALGSLRVCWNEQGAGNCSGCPKCLRTMIMLDAAGALGACPAFDTAHYGPERIRRTYLPNDSEMRAFAQAGRFAERHGRPELAAAVSEALRWSRRLSRWRRAARLAQALPWVGPAVTRSRSAIVGRVMRKAVAYRHLAMPPPASPAAS